jgi:transposase
MTKYSKIYGVDISKDVFDVADQQEVHYQFKNNASGFKAFSKMLTANDLIVMEATGYYHYRLAQYLFKSGFCVSLVNPLQVKRFIQMQLSKVKTDKSDAKAICKYATVNKVPLYNALNDTQAECLQLFRLLDNYIRQRTMIKNKLHGEKTLGKPSKVV